ncbi:MAG: hypothetical protein HY767_03070 [Candidatus Omnitrophica bacterium]|nr:hypothetical protein [Candidatus Omnitrophota bacterium]
MRFEFKSSFERSIKSLHSPEKDEVKEAAWQLIDVLSKDRQIHQGLGLKRLMGDYWEVRKGIKARILFRWKGDLIEFVLAGNHDGIKRFLKNS